MDKRKESGRERRRDPPKSTTHRQPKLITECPARALSSALHAPGASPSLSPSRERGGKERERSALTHNPAQTPTQPTYTHSEGVVRSRRAPAGWCIDTEEGMLSGISQKRNLRSSPYWFTEFCNSQCLSQFAAPFINVRAEVSITEGCI